MVATLVSDQYFAVLDTLIHHKLYNSTALAYQDRVTLDANPGLWCDSRELCTAAIHPNHLLVIPALLLM